MIGTRLAHYEITGHLGSGGFGDVYQATDSKLGRSVALKLLPEEFASDADRLARFRREAQVLASLNHSNVAAIHGFEDSGGRLFLVMELVLGETLQSRLQRGPIPVDEALAIAKQIADALEAAHDKGVVHRDLKPGNVMVTADGKVKVLDFGLAKGYTTNPSSAAALSNSPTMASLAATNAGIILGTAAYVSPEQARGKTVDKRADIWAFGVVLFEMLTGQRAFPGEDLTETLASVVKVDPKWDAIGEDVPSRVRQAVRMCVQKDPTQQAHDIADVRLALDGAFETAAPQTTTSVPASSTRARLGWIAFAAALLAGAMLAVPAMRHLRETPPSETRVDIVTPASDHPASFALSPDGRQIVFVAFDEKTSRLWLRSLAATTAQPLPGTEGALLPFWSPDGRSIAFFSGNELKRLDLGTGAPRRLALVAAGQGGTWNADGVIVFAPSTTGALMRVPATGGAAVAVTQLAPQQGGHFAPHFLPDGRRFLFGSGGAADGTGIYLGALDGSTPVRLSNRRTTVYDYLPSGWLLFVDGAGPLQAQRLDPDRKALEGEPQTIADGVTHVSASTTGLVAYRTVSDRQHQLAWFDRTGMTRGTVGDPDRSLLNPRLSPDGHRVIVSRTVEGNQDLWLIDGARMSRFTFDAALDRFATWSPDGARIVFYSGRTGGGDLYMKLASGGGAEQQLAAPDRFKLPTSWSADGRFLLYQRTDPQTSSDLWVMVMSGAREAQARKGAAGGNAARQGAARRKWTIIRRPYS